MRGLLFFLWMLYCADNAARPRMGRRGAMLRACILQGRAVDPKLIETARARYRPSRIATLFVGESAPKERRVLLLRRHCAAWEMAGRRRSSRGFRD